MVRLCTMKRVKVHKSKVPSKVKLLVVSKAAVLKQKKENSKLKDYECVVLTPSDEFGLNLTFEAKDKDGNPNEDLAQFIKCLTAHIEYYKEVPVA
mmetsp:Transcript_3108/g.4172  ORF Transcript_3108/g.4172 Transcript_3108/m.4172 type:complete len:95 (+) Transcript_3108:37-321(+)